ncbi:GAF domain-containing sensor histidine kinase [Actinacidiphila glaucinigra]|uniref:GAF domain-containing sensor histidine kinase n=1 Tax=Actinacidiphila glaucinigra TaxID=235986 RepID=UPI002DDC0E0D|nr:histidine kinase [Actinacidiphila glaucinigra]
MAEPLARLLDAVGSVTSALLADEQPGDDALDVVAEQARALVGADAGLVLLPTVEGGLEVVAVSAEQPAGLVGTVLEADSPPVAPLMAGEPVFVEDAASDDRMTMAIAPRFGACMILPLQSSGHVMGALALPRAHGVPGFTEDERFVATQFAAQAALALLLAGAQRDRNRLAVYEERDRIARDLHDLVIQRLFATGLMLQGARRKALPPDAEEGIAHAVEELDATIQEVRTAIFALQQEPRDDAPAGLRAQVLRETGSAARGLGFPPSVRFVGPVDHRVGALSARNLVAALREALSNVQRHAGATWVEVVLDATAVLSDGREGVRLIVSDDGVGIPETGRRSGLRNLARRAESLGGESIFGPGPDGKGTTLAWEAPL